MSSPSQSPRTIFILDVSGSMKGIKSETLQISAKRYIEDISANSYVGIVLFEDRAWIEHKVVKITDRSVRNSLIAKVPTNFGGRTDIGSGLLMGLSSLTQEKLNTEGANFILVTDGEDTTETNYVDRVLPFIINAKIKIFCIALGNKADPNLEKLVKETNGNVYIASDSNREMAIRVIESAFNEAKANKELNETLTIGVCNELITIKRFVEKQVIIDPDIGRNTNFTISSENIDQFTVSITSPNGQLYDSSSDEFTKNQSYKRYQLRVKNAESGVWTIAFRKHTNDILSANISVTSQPLNPNAIQMKVWIKDADINTGMPPLIFALLRKGNETVIGADVIATIDKPNGTQTDIKLNNYNNIYCNYFTDYSGPGRYNVSVLAKNSGNNCQLLIDEKSKSSSGFQNVPPFERQRIFGCFKIIDFMPEAPINKKKLEDLIISESLKMLSLSSNRLENTVEAPAPRIAKAPTARIRTPLIKKVEQQSDEIQIAKDNLRDSLLVVKKLVTFSKLSEDEKFPYKQIVEGVDSFIYSKKAATMEEVNRNRLKLEEVKQKFSQR